MARILLAVCVLCAATLRTGFGQRIVNAIYGETIVMPCGLDIVDNLLFGKWKYEKGDGPIEFVASRSALKKQYKYDDVPEYNGRLNLTENYTLTISDARIRDEKKFVCMLITDDNVFEAQTLIKVFKPPSKPEIINQPKFMEVGKLNKVGECVSKESYPDGNLTWYRNGQVILPIEGAVSIEWEKEKNSTSGLYSMSSSLEYVATKEDINSQLTCLVTYSMPEGQLSAISDPAVFEIYYPTEKVTIKVQPATKTIKEGDNVTLKCIGNGNPPPQEFLFYPPGEEEGIISSGTYQITDIKRNATGEYKCSLPNKNMMASATLTVHYLDLSLSPSGEVTKQIGEALNLSCIPYASKDVTIIWFKDSKSKASLQTSFKSLKYTDSGVYDCESFLLEDGSLRKKKTVKLTVEGIPRLKLSKRTNPDGKTKTVTCDVEGVPKPEVRWSSLSNGLYINITEETPFTNGKFSSKIIISPDDNITVSCFAENRLGKVAHSLNVSAISFPEQDEPNDKSDDSSDHAKLIVGIVVGLLLAALVAGIAYWIYMKKNSGTKHVGKELGNTEENKKLEENNHKSEA
ncbi:CD166 antigen [Bombina bombina]|uniref:CD166 antigen n=1 Tax=Bombina bombina TaxID=8345 RepID=UPI00235AB9C6|nr:CD166 antigen [Bombina bombina]